MSGFYQCTMGALLQQVARAHPDNDALVYSDRDLRYSFRELDARVTRLARGLLASGVSRGDHVGIWATNVPDFVPIMFATARIGAVLVTINPSYRQMELEYVLRQSDMKVLFAIDAYRDMDYVQTLYDLLPELKSRPRGELGSERFPVLEKIISLGPKQHRGMFGLDEVLQLGEKIDDARLQQAAQSIEPDELANIQYTSGTTTGLPKGVMLTHRGLVNNGFAIGARQKFTPADRLCLPVPLFHCFGITLGVLAAYTHGATVVPLETYDPLMVLAVVQKERCTALHGVPTMFIAELTHPMFNMFDLSSLRTGIMAGSPCPEPVMREVMEKMHCHEITIVYGLTEASPGITQTRTDDSVEVRVKTVGKPFDGVEVKVIDVETGAEVPDNVPGELCSRGYNTMKGYYKMPQETAVAITEGGWLHSGDIALRTEDGFYKITGRLKDVIIRGGENIYAKEVEDFLHSMPGIRDVQVVGVPSEKYGEEVAAFVQLRNGTLLEPSEIQDFCRGKIARYKIPKHIFFVDSYPMTTSGKVQKFKLRADGAARLARVTSSQISGSPAGNQPPASAAHAGTEARKVL